MNVTLRKFKYTIVESSFIGIRILAILAKTLNNE